MQPYIEVTRHFVKLGDSIDATPAWIPRLGGQLTWSRILMPAQEEHIVLHAPSGYGKSTEVLQEARRRRASGVRAVAGTATAITDLGVREGIDAENRAAFDAWLATSEPAILFVDAVDELALRNKNLYDLIRRLDSAVPFADREIQLVLTVRTGSWLPSHTGQLQNFLATDPKTEPSVAQLTFAPLDEAALRALGIGYGVSDVDGLLGALRNEEITSLFDIRPRDVSWLVQKWNESRHLGKWSELLNDFCDSALEDETHERALERVMSVREGHLGLQRTAAGMLFCKRGFIAVPSAERLPQTISSRRLFDDWTTAKAHNLLQTALFVHKGMHGQAVQLAAETLTPFLAARWLAERARAGLNIDELQELVMVRAFGERDFHIPGSRMKLAGWLASEWPEFRTLIMQTRPEMVLFEGDPDLLTDRELEQALLSVASALLAGGSDTTPTQGTLRKLSRPSLEAAAFSLLSTRPITEAVQVLALQLARFGRYRSCIPLALRIALDASETEYVRREAIATVTEAGDAADQARLIPLTGDPSFRIRIELLELVPDMIHGTDLVQLMVGGGELEFRFYVKRMAHRIHDNDLDAILGVLEPVLKRTVIDAQTEAAYSAGLPLVTELVRRGRCTPAAVSILRAIDGLMEHNGVFISDDELNRLRAALGSNAACRHALLEARLDSAKPYAGRINRFGQATSDDIPWLVGEWKKSRRREKRLRPKTKANQPIVWRRSDFLDRLIDDLFRGLSVDQQQSARSILPKELVASIDARTAQIVNFEQERARQDAKQRSKDAARRTKNTEALKPRIAKIERGEDVDALLRAWEHIGEDQGAKRARRNFTPLAELVGDELVPVFVRGLKAFWRKNPIGIPDPGKNGVFLRDHAGLTGLTLEIDDGLDLHSLSPDEARRAAIYALHEMNSFPFWFEDLVAAQPQIVEPVLREMIARTWNAGAPNATVLRFGPYAPRRVTELMRKLLLDVATANAPVSRQALEDGIDTLLTSDTEQLRLVSIAKKGIAADAKDDERLPQWLRLLAHTDPIGAAKYMESVRTANPQRFEKVLEAVANFLEQDLSDRYRMSLVSAMVAPRALSAWFRLLLLGVSPGRDVKHPSGTAHFVGARDHAQQFRDRCISLLQRDPTEAAHDELVKLTSDPSLVAYRPWLRAAVQQQLEVAREAVARPWSEEEVLLIERADERPPKTLDDLFALVRSHIVHIDRLITKDDFSYRDVFSEDTAEREIQLWAASNLRERARGLYSVVRENVVDEDKEVDISALAAGVGQVPIEIKPLGPYSLPALKDVIVEQLLGQYMQPNDRRCGMLLLVRRERERWQLQERWLALDELVLRLQEFATGVGRRHGKTIVVEAIDLLKQSGSSSFRAEPWRPRR